jgi:hypothetical protein
VIISASGSLTAAAVHGGTEPDLLDEVAWWQDDDFWRYAMFAVVAYICAAARAGPRPIVGRAREQAAGVLGE